MAKQTFTTGQVLLASQVNSLQANDFNQTVSVKTASYTLAAADKGTRIEFNTSASVTCTVNSGLFDAGDTLVIQNRGAGVVTVTPGTATVNTSATLALSQYDAGTLYFISNSASIFFNTDAGGGSPLTTKGDLYGFSTVDARIPIGANNTVLTADSNESLGLKWAAASAGALTFISRSTFSAVATADIDNIFSSTYETYMVVIEECFSSSDSNLNMQLRYAGPNTQTTGYYGQLVSLAIPYTNISGTNTNNGAAQPILRQIRTGTGQASNMTFTINQVGNGSRNPILYGIGNGCSLIEPSICNGYMATARVYTGIRLAAASGNLTANVSVYGLAKS